MPAKDLSQWHQNEDGSWSRLHGKTVVEVDESEIAKPAETASKAAEVFTDLVASSDSDGYANMTKPELEAELESRGLPKYGNKPELIARLQEDDG